MFLENSRKYFPELILELEGISDGIGVDFTKVKQQSIILCIYLNAYKHTVTALENAQGRLAGRREKVVGGRLQGQGAYFYILANAPPPCSLHIHVHVYVHNNVVHMYM